MNIAYKFCNYYYKYNVKIAFRNQHKNYWSLWSSKGVEYIKES